MVVVDLQRHGAIFGRTNSGKTTLARNLIFNRAKTRVVFLNVQDEAHFGARRHEWRLSAIREPGSKMNLVLPRPSASQENAARYRDIVNQVVDDCFAFGERIRTDGDRTTWVYIIVDEAHHIAPKKPPANGLTLMATNGARYGVRYCALTQRPALLDHTVISQADMKILLDLDDAERPYLDHYRVPSWVQEHVGRRTPTGDLQRNIAVQIGKDWHLCPPFDARRGA